MTSFMRHFLLRLTCLITLLPMLACKDITHVQTGYVADRDECRTRSESGAGVYAQPEAYQLNDKERDTALLQLFCECMKQRDWKVAGCPKPPTQVAATPAPQQPTVVVVQAPTAQPAVMPEPTPAPAAPAVGVKKKKYCPPPMSVCPAPADASGAKSTLTPVQTDQQLNTIIQRQ